MMQHSRDPSAEDLERFLQERRQQIGRFLGQFKGGAILVFAVLALLIWLASGTYVVGPDERALVRTFGRVTAINDQGLHWRLPGPIARHDTVKVTQVRRMPVGLRTTPTGVTQTVPIEALMITGDENIVDVEMVVLYRIAEIDKYLLRVKDPGDPSRPEAGLLPEARTLKDAAEVALRGVVGSRPIDNVLTEERAAMETEVLDVLRALLQKYNTGIEVQQVQLQTVKPPQQVQAAFDDVVSAKEDKQRLINEARAYAADIIPRARGNAERLVNEARGYEATRVNQARGRAAQFLATLQEYAKAPEVTRQRLYLETIETILAKVNLVVLDGEVGNRTLPFLPLPGVSPEQATTPPAPQPPK